MTRGRAAGRRLTVAVLVLALVAVTVLLLSYVFQRRLIYLPYGDLPSVPTVLPRAEAVSFTTEDGLRLDAWFVPARGDGATPPTILLLPGNAGNRSFRAPLARRLADDGSNVLLVDYRGYGRNPGSPTEEGLARDARAARAYLLGRDDVAGGQLFYFGESLGAAVAVRLATEHPPAGLILRSPFSSLADMGRVHYPFLPVGLLLRDRYPVVELVGEVAAPVLVVAAEDDRTVPVEQSRAVYEAADAPKELVVVPGVDHNAEELLVGLTLIDAVRDFMREVR